MARDKHSQARKTQRRAQSRKSATKSYHWQPAFFSVLRSRTPGCWQRALEIKERHLPERLFKYRPANEWTWSSLGSGTVWMAAPITMNDPLDASVRLDGTPHLLATARDKMITELLPPGHPRIPDLKRIAVWPDFLAAFIDVGLAGHPASEREQMIARAHAHWVATEEKEQERFSAEFRRFARVCAMTTEPTSVIMWSHYAQNHTGLCIEYSLRHSDAASARRLLYPVEYSPTRFDIGPWGFDTTPESREPGLPLVIAALRKNVHWEYEQEWRLVDVREFDPSPGYSLPMPKPSAIYLGMAISAGNEVAVRALAGDVPLYKMKLSRERYAMEAVPIV